MSFSGHGPVLKKMSIVTVGDAPQIKCEIERNGERAGVTFNFPNMVRRITYTFEDDLIYSAKRELSGDFAEHLLQSEWYAETSRRDD